MPQVVAYLLQLAGALPQLIAAGKDAYAFWKEHSAKVDEMMAQNRPPTAEEWQVMNSAIAELRADLHS